MTIKFHLPEEVAERALDGLRNLPIKSKAIHVLSRCYKATFSSCGIDTKHLIGLGCHSLTNSYISN